LPQSNAKLRIQPIQFRWEEYKTPRGEFGREIMKIMINRFSRENHDAWPAADLTHIWICVQWQFANRDWVWSVWGLGTQSSWLREGKLISPEWVKLLKYSKDVQYEGTITLLDSFFSELAKACL
jgi:hypothetical protein